MRPRAYGADITKAMKAGVFLRICIGRRWNLGIESAFPDTPPSSIRPTQYAFKAVAFTAKAWNYTVNISKKLSA